jgi:hypothetical protein
MLCQKFNLNCGTKTKNYQASTNSQRTNSHQTGWVAISGVCDRCEEEMGIKYFLYTCTKFDPPANHHGTIDLEKIKIPLDEFLILLDYFLICDI